MLFSLVNQNKDVIETKDCNSMFEATAYFCNKYDVAGCEIIRRGNAPK